MLGRTPDQGLAGYLLSVFLQALECSGPVENWLPQLVNSIKESLQHHLWEAMENSNVVITRRKEIHSAGARRVVINKTVSKEEAAAEKRSMQ